MSLETFATAISKCPPEMEFSFAGFAEPWLNNRATEMAEMLAGRTWEIYTTCVGMNEGDVDRIVAARPIRIKLHLADNEGYAKIKVDEHYLKVVNRLADKFPVNIMTMGTLPLDLLRRFGKIKAAYMHSRAGNVKLTVKKSPPRKLGPLRCRPGPKLDRCVLLPDGTLSLCCMDFGQQHIIGNMLENTWDEIHAGEPMRLIREAMASRDGNVLCRTCEMSECA